MRMQLGGATMLPQYAGDAKIEFVGNDDWLRLPDRFFDEIKLPFGERNSYESLMDGKQFIFRDTERELLVANGGSRIPTWDWFGIEPLRTRPDDGAFVYFGGTDEKPFLTGLTLQPYKILADQGEAAFYDSLVPSRIGELSKRFGVTAKRQGDIWALPLPCDVESLTANMLNLGNLPVQYTEAEDKHKSKILCNTRHCLKEGTIHHIQVYDDRIKVERGVNSIAAATSGRRNMVVCEGRVCAPDHADLVLEGPHIIEQTAHLRDRFQTD